MDLPDHCIDYRGRRIEFPLSAVRHISYGHPEVYSYLPRICEVLAESDIVFSRPSQNTHIYCKSGICIDEYTSSYFVVYVSYTNVGRAIETAYSTGRLPNGLFRIYPRRMT